MNQKGRVCVFGSFNIDAVANVPRFPKPGESLIAHDSMTGLGGKGINQAIAASRAGARIHFIGKIGTDEYTDICHRMLDNAGLEIFTLFTAENVPTGKALIFVSDDGAENMIAVHPGANMTVTHEEVDRALKVVEASDILLTQLENNIDALQALIEKAHRESVYTIVNPAPYQPMPESLFAKIDLITPNTTEAELLTGIEVIDRASAERAATVLHQKGVENVIITLGSNGALLSHEGRTQLVPCIPTDAVDTTGAGDSFNGALAARLADGDTLEQAVIFASAYASCAVEKHGTALAMPTMEEAQKKINAYCEFV